MQTIDDSVIQEIIIGRVEPHIYTFETNTLPNLLKVGDSYRPVEERLNEWRRYYKDLAEVSRHKALVNDDVFFRDHSVHKYLVTNGKTRIAIDKANNILSNEFFDHVDGEQVAAAVKDIIENYGTPGKYTYYDNLKDKVELHYTREANFKPRSNQQEVIDNFNKAIASGRTNLLMYAVMRFGKSVTSLWCAKEINSKLTIVVSAKADVRAEWKSSVESHQDFAGYRFMESSDLKPGISFEKIYGTKFYTGGSKTETCTNIVLFLTLQDLAGSKTKVKEHHKILQKAKPDLLIIDETHFGARAQVLGKILAGVSLSEEDALSLKQTDGIDELGTLNGLAPINAKIKLHLSGTPYRILMGSEFAKEDIIAFVQFSDIYTAKLQWNLDNLDNDAKSEWDNPYYGFPQMIRFAFNPNERSRKKLASIPGSKPAEIFAPVDTAIHGNYETFSHEQEAIELLQVLDGTKKDSQLLGLLDNESVKAGKLARHIVIVLPFKASCDAFEKLVSSQPVLFKNLSKYKILNISGHNSTLNTPEQIKAAITTAENNNEKTITLTVSKMLTGTTVPQWDTMIYLKATVSPQEYDQAIFRLQSPWVKEYTSDTGEVIKYDMKPQTLLVDLDPTRLFYLQEAKALSYGANTGEIGNENIEQSIARELKISPVLALNAENSKLIEIDATVIIDAVRKYASERSITEDVNEIAVDISLRDNEAIYGIINGLAEINGKNGLSITPNNDEGQDIDTGNEQPVDADDGNDSGQTSSNSTTLTDENAAIKTFEKQFRMYYVLILLFAFLSDTEEKSLADVITNITANADNRRIANSLGLNKEHLIAVRQNINWSVLSTLDYKIQNSDYRANDAAVSPVEHINIAINKFGKLSDSEVFTPTWIVEKMYSCFDDDFWVNSGSAKVLDIASKSGSFANSFVEHASRYGMSVDAIKNSFYSIPTSPAAYEFTRKMYEALGLNVANIAKHFTSYDILSLKNPSAIPALLERKKLSEITREDLGTIDDKIEIVGRKDKIVKFSAIVGNPPYQESVDGYNRQEPIYQYFYDSAEIIGDKYCLISPARFLFNAGLTPKQWNAKMLNNKNLKVAYYNPNSSELFPNTDIKGGVAVIFYNKNQEFGEIRKFIPEKKLQAIVEKVNSKQEPKITEIFYGGRSDLKFNDQFLKDYPSTKIDRLHEIQIKHPEVTELGPNEEYELKSSTFKTLPYVFKESSPADSNNFYKILGLSNGKRVQRWIEKKYMNPRYSQKNNIEKWKVFIPESNGSGSFGETLSTPVIGKPSESATPTFISIGAFDKENQAINASKYVKTKFLRCLLGVLKITHHNPRSNWSYIPLQDFTQNSDIDWSQPIQDIDKQLYAKYGLDNIEISFIESHVRQME